MGKEQFAYVRGETLPVDRAFLHISDLAVQRGYGVFDFFKIENGHPYFLNDYLDRFYNSASVMRLDVPLSRADLRDVIYELIEKNDLAQSGIKMILTGGYSPDGFQIHNPNLIITQHLLTLPTKEQIEKGVKIITHEYVRDMPAAKTINYTMGIWLLEKVKEASASDVLYHKQGVVSEFPRCNFFIVTSDNVVVTPSQAVLHGITRKNILKITSDRYKVKEGTVTRNDIRDAKEAFLTSTTKRIIPVVNVDDRQVGDGKPGYITKLVLDDIINAEALDLNRGK